MGRTASPTSALYVLLAAILLIASALLGLITQTGLTRSEHRDAFLAEPVRGGSPGPGSADAALGIESVIGADERVQITNTTVVPWRRIAYLEFDLAGGAYDSDGSCTGAFIGPTRLARALRPASSFPGSTRSSPTPSRESCCSPLWPHEPGPGLRL